MKILIINGSGRKHGNTAQALHLLQEQITQQAAAADFPLEIESLCLRDYQLQPCLGCRACFDRGETSCPLNKNDDYLRILEKMRSAEGLIVASPVYVDDVSGLTKTWIDRTAWACHRPEFGGKSVYALATVGSSPCSHTLRTLTLGLGTWGYHLVGKSGLKMGALMQPDASREQFEGWAVQTARRFLRALQKEEALTPSFFSLMMFRIQQIGWSRTLTEDSPDKRHWQGNGWLEPQTSFYFPHRAGWLKTRSARLTGRVISWFTI